MSKGECVGQKAAIRLALAERNAGLDAFRTMLLLCLLGGGVAIVGFGARSLEPMIGMAIEATLPLAGFLLGSRLSSRSDGSPRMLLTIWKASVRIMPVHGVGMLILMTLAMRTGMPIPGGGIHLGLVGTLLGSRRDDLAWAWPVAVVWWGHVVLAVLSEVLRWIPWARVRYRNVWLSGWLLVVVVPVLRETSWRLMPLEATDLVHGAVWRLDSVAWGVVVYGILRRFPELGSARAIGMAGAVGLTGFGMAGLGVAAIPNWSVHKTLLGVVQCATAISTSLLLPWCLVWRVPWDVRTRPWLELASRMSYPVFISFIVVFQAGGRKVSGLLGAGAIQRSLSALLLSVGVAWVVAVFVQPVLNRLLLGQARKVRGDG